MADGDRTEDSGGFDEWLDEDAGPDTDPYASLADDDAEAEIADWMAFTQGQESDEDLSGTPDPSAASDPSDPSEADTDDAEQIADDADAPDATDASDASEASDASDSSDSSDASDAPDAADGGDADESASDDASAGFVDFDDDDDVTAEIPLAADADETTEPATSVDVGEFVGDGRADTDEIPILAAADVVSASMVNETDESKQRGSLDDPDALTQMPAVVVAADGEDAGDTEDAGDSEASEASDTSEGDAASNDGTTGDGDEGEPSDEADGDAPDDDTGELEAVDAQDADDTGELDVVDEEAAVAARVVPFADDDDDDDETPSSDGDDAEPQFFDISREDIVHTATKEHETLAAAIAEAETEETEQVALAAPIPGLESTVVGFDDVVEAEGHRKARARGGGNLLARVITAIVLILALAASLVWRPALLILATVVFVIGAGEFYTALTRTGRHPIALFGFAGIVAATVGAYFSGAIAITAAYVLVLTVLLLFYAVVPGRRDPMGNLALTITVMVWVGLGSYAMLIAVSENWRPLVVGTVILVAAMDIAQYFVGRAIGRHPLAPWVSPKKTIEGLVGGVIVALGLGALLHFVEPFELTSGLTLGAAVAVLAPLGDLAMSAAKRSLDLKDMGSILPGHGGFLDRIDGLLFVIPAAWAIFLWTGLL